MRVSGLKLIGNTFQVGGSFADQLHGIVIGMNSAYIEVTGCYITNFLGDCIAMGGNFSNGTLLGFACKYINVHHNTFKERYGNGVKSQSGGSASRLAFAVTDCHHVHVADNLIFGSGDCEPDVDGQVLRQIKIENNDFKNGPVIAQVAIGDDYNFDEQVVDRGTVGSSDVPCLLVINGIPGNPVIDGVLFKDNSFEIGTITALLAYAADIIDNTFDQGLILLGSTAGANETKDMEIIGNSAKALHAGQTAFIRFDGLVSFCRFINNSVRAAGGYVFRDNGVNTGDAGRNFFAHNINSSDTAVGVFNFLQTAAISMTPGYNGPRATSVSLGNWNYSGDFVEVPVTGVVKVTEIRQDLIIVNLTTMGTVVAGTVYDLDYDALHGNKLFFVVNAGSAALRTIFNVPDGTTLTHYQWYRYWW